MGQVHSRVYSSTARRSERGRVVVRKGIGINRKPIPEQRNAIAEIKASGTFTRVGSRRFIEVAGHAEIAVKEPLERDWQTCSAQYHGAAESEFEISSGFETHFLAMKKRAGRNLMALQRAEIDVPAHGAKQFEYARQVKGRDAVDMKHSNGKGIVAVEKRPGLIG